MAIDFPASPTLNDVFTVGNVTYVWDGTKWTASVTGGISLDKIEEGNTSAEVIDTGSDGRFVVTTEGTERLRVTDTGRVGIGTASPNGNTNYGSLDLNGSAGGEIFFSSGGVSRGNIFNYSATPANLGIAATDASGQIIFNTGGYTERLRITSAGLVGIGSSAPQGRFESAAGDSTDYAIVANNSLSTGGEPNYISLNSGATRIGSINRSVNDIALKAYFGSVSFWTGTGGTATQKAVIDSSGRLGIGTTSPQDTFHLNTASGSTTARISSSTNTSGLQITARGDGTGTQLAAFGTSSDLRFFTTTSGGSTNEALRVDSNQRLLVGTSSGSGNNLLQVQGESGSSAGIGGIVLRRGLAPSLLVSGSIMGRIDFGPNDGGVGASIVGEGDAQQGTSDYPSRLVFSTTADGASSPTERMRIHANGFTTFTTSNTSQSVGTGVKLTPNGNVYVVVSTGDSFSHHSGSAYKFYVGNDGSIASTSGTISVISDQRFKENIRDLDDGLNKVLALQPRKFDWKEGKGSGTKNERGFIAQEFEQVFPDLIGEWKDPAPEGEDPYKSVRADLIPVLVKAVQEQQAIIEGLEARLAALESA
jgi:hypothetical protein